MEIKRIVAQAARQVAGIAVDLDWDTRRFHPGAARDLLVTAFDDVDVHELGDSFPVRAPAIVSGYLASWPPEAVGLRAGPVWTEVLATSDELVAAHFASHGEFLVTSRVAVLRCH